LTTENPGKFHRFKQLDSLRGLAAFFVFLSHYFLLFNIYPATSAAIKASPLGILINGNSAVMFFFVLSGFVLSLPFIENKKTLSLSEFYIKRIFRIYPAYIAAIILAVVLKTFVYHSSEMSHFSDWLRGFWQWKWDAQYYKEMLKTLLLVGPNFNADIIDPVIWSLVVEMKMSFLLPFFIVVASKSNLTFNILFFLVVIMFTYSHAFGYLEVFYLGVIIAKYREKLISRMKAVSRLQLLGISLMLVFLYNINFEFYKPYGDSVHIFGYFWRNSVTAIACAAIIVMALSNKKLDAVLQKRPLIFLGDISYSFYLIHLPILITLCSWFSSGSVISYVIIFLLDIAISFTVSYIFFKMIELPGQRVAKQLLARFGVLSPKWLNL